MFGKTGCDLLFNTGVAPLLPEGRGFLTSPAWHRPPTVREPFDPFGDEGGLLPEFEVHTWDSSRGGWVVTIETRVFGDPPPMPPSPDYTFVLEAALPARSLDAWSTEADGLGRPSEARIAALVDEVARTLDAMQRDASIVASEVRVDGAGARDDALLQRLADRIRVPVIRGVVADDPDGDSVAAFGAAALAGVAVGVWPDAETATTERLACRTFRPIDETPWPVSFIDPMPSPDLLPDLPTDFDHEREEPRLGRSWGWQVGDVLVRG